MPPDQALSRPRSDPGTPAVSLHGLSDEELMRRVQRGRSVGQPLSPEGRLALEELHRRRHRHAIAWLLRVFHLRQDLAEDLVQSVFLRLARCVTFDATRQTFRAYLLNCVRNAAVDHFRAAPALQVDHQRSVALLTAQAAEEAIAREAALPDLIEDMERCLGRCLNERDRDIVTWWMRGESQTAIAGRLDVNVSTVNRRYHASLRRLRECIERSTAVSAAGISRGV
jgi:RNA polymerase sigma factor (sigma-70 family)